MPALDLGSGMGMSMADMDSNSPSERALMAMDEEDRSEINRVLAEIKADKAAIEVRRERGGENLGQAGGD